MMAARTSCGTISFSIDRCLPVMVAGKIVNPVMLPPGRAMLATNPLPTGSATDTNTIGIVRVACMSAVTTGVLWPRMQSGLVPPPPSQGLHAHRIAFGIAVLDAKVLAEGPALAFETFFERLDASLGF